MVLEELFEAENFFYFLNVLKFLVANDDLGIPGSIEELEVLVEQKSFRKAEDHTKEEYFQVLVFL